jgi:hypothetical protein
LSITKTIRPNRVEGWNPFDKGEFFSAVSLDGTNPADYDSLLLLDSVANPAQLGTIALGSSCKVIL